MEARNLFSFIFITHLLMVYVCDITIYIFDIYVIIHIYVCVYVCIYDNYRGKKKAILVAGLKEVL